MTEVLWAFAADQFIIDRGGKFSIIGIWENVFAATFPALHPQLFIIAGWKGQPSGQFTYEVRIWTPGKTLLVTTGPAPFQLSPIGKGITANQFTPVQLMQPGTYNVEILLNGVPIHTLELSASPISPQGPQMPNA